MLRLNRMTDYAILVLGFCMAGEAGCYPVPDIIRAQLTQATVAKIARR